MKQSKEMVIVINKSIGKHAMKYERIIKEKYIAICRCCFDKFNFFEHGMNIWYYNVRDKWTNVSTTFLMNDGSDYVAFLTSFVFLNKDIFSFQNHFTILTILSINLIRKYEKQLIAKWFQVQLACYKIIEL